MADKRLAAAVHGYDSCHHKVWSASNTVNAIIMGREYLAFDTKMAPVQKYVVVGDEKQTR